MINLGVSPVDPCVKVDDTTPGIEEGLNAGMWTVGLAMSGNEIGLLRRTRRRSPPPIARAAASARSRKSSSSGARSGGVAEYVGQRGSSGVALADAIEPRTSAT